MPAHAKRSGSSSRVALLRVNQLLAEQGAAARIVEARNAAEREMLGYYIMVGYPDRHIVVRDNVDLYELAHELSALEGGTTC